MPLRQSHECSSSKEEIIAGRFIALMASFEILSSKDQGIRFWIMKRIKEELRMMETVRVVQLEWNKSATFHSYPTHRLRHLAQLFSQRHLVRPWLFFIAQLFATAGDPITTPDHRSSLVSDVDWRYRNFNSALSATICTPPLQR
jgi:hypothetical protein